MDRTEQELADKMDVLRASVVDDISAGRYRFLTEKDRGEDVTKSLLNLALRQAQYQLDQHGNVTSEAASSLLGALVLHMFLEDILTFQPEETEDMEDKPAKVVRKRRA